MIGEQDGPLISVLLLLVRLCGPFPALLLPLGFPSRLTLAELTQSLHTTDELLALHDGLGNG